MTLDFTYAVNPATIVFGDGRSSEIGTWIERIGCRRALVLTTTGQADKGRQLAAELGEKAAGTFDGAVMHTPVEVTERAMAVVEGTGADCVVSLGGGSTIGLGKAMAHRDKLSHVAVPTTYAGSEVTGILGQTEHGRKTTLRDTGLAPQVVIYDPQLTLGLPLDVSITSGLNAMAHAAEALYALDRNPISTLMAIEGLKAMKTALPGLLADPRDVGARTTALYGAWLCGTVLGMLEMALHHKICHTLGGSFETPHAQTHAIMLPHTIAFNEAAVAEQLQPLAEFFGGSAGGGLWDFARSIGAPRALSELGLDESDLDRAADIAVEKPYPNPRSIDRDSIRSLLQDAWNGARPSGGDTH